MESTLPDGGTLEGVREIAQGDAEVLTTETPAVVKTHPNGQGAGISPGDWRTHDR
jgi:hypothetical protein